MKHASVDVIVVGSGINSLVCAVLLGKRGHRVLVLEREEVAGGCIRTESLTVPGFVHDTLSTLYPLFLTAPYFPMLAPDLERHGIEFRNVPHPTAVLTPTGSLVFSTDRERNAAALDALADGEGAAYRTAMQDIERNAPLIFGLLGGETLSWPTLRLLARELRARGFSELTRFFGESAASARAWLERSFSTELARALFAPWVLHVGLSPESTGAGLMNRLILFTLEQVGSPMVTGGSARLVEALSAMIRERGGDVRCGADVVKVCVDGGVANGVQLASGEEIRASRAVVANVTPPQLYGRLLAGAGVAESVRSSAQQFRFGRGEMQIHLALDEPPEWPDPALLGVGMLHVTGGLNAVSRAVNEAERGLLPAEATIVVAQPIAIDPSRAPPGKWIFWIQLQEVPRDGQLRGDALGEIPVSEDGRWSAEVREAYADRIIDRLAARIPNLRRSILARRVISPADLAAMNVNLVDGDPYSGSCELDQFMAWRPSRSGGAHGTSVRRLYHIGASTHPGPGLGGMSGYMVAQKIG